MWPSRIRSRCWVRDMTTTKIDMILELINYFIIIYEVKFVQRWTYLILQYFIQCCGQQEKDRLVIFYWMIYSINVYNLQISNQIYMPFFNKHTKLLYNLFSNYIMYTITITDQQIKKQSINNYCKKILANVRVKNIGKQGKR